ncbi:MULTISPECIES: flagellin lysine-N-methylase [Bacillus cereus group]|uniref:flagellin lysine-N-methylase n=1 Tax=Bacillus cereus group TaxID=86661 RepID=UPI001298CBB4|nr:MULTISPECIES: flagellin lysine-N-methylase [Bacillus cereus group]MCR6789929.1 flagellin lysine-N-methylase [Bacillus thuringiensis]MCR6825909.1 flagellin lysine-N-methylase [Bacillus thuringiensis]MCR6831761.1 flagellin lysine-N-methylase [Bacillus thuringiensis]MEB9327357.1 flagellin lysine-N-methylase [Bacillus cereus]MEB9914535.1 flagellin lysine-N-methylase [Bacillus cereus]
MKSNPKQYIANYFTSFSCIGPDCEDHCCSNWTIYVDKEHYDWYQTDLFAPSCSVPKQFVKKNKEPERTEQQYGIIELNDKGNCPCLTEGKLCQIHISYGLKGLPNVCRSYPRETIHVNGDQFEIGDLSCPEVTRLVLYSEELPTFKQHLHTEASQLSPAKEYQINKNTYQQIQQNIFHILQQRQYPLVKRLLIIGVWMEVFTVVTQKETRGIQKGFKIAEREIQKYKHLQAPSNFRTDLLFWIPIIRDMYHHTDTNSRTGKRFIDCLEHWKEGMKIRDGAVEILEYNKNFKTAYQKKYIPFLHENTYVLENYCAYYFQKNLFPYPPSSISLQYMLFIIEFSLFSHLLIGIAASSGGLHAEILIQLVQSYTKLVHHNPAYTSMLIDIHNSIHKKYKTYTNCLSFLLGFPTE